MVKWFPPVFVHVLHVLVLVRVLVLVLAHLLVIFACARACAHACACVCGVGAGYGRGNCMEEMYRSRLCTRKERGGRGVVCASKHIFPGA